MDKGSAGEDVPLCAQQLGQQGHAPAVGGEGVAAAGGHGLAQPAALGIRDNTTRCLWLEEVQTCQPGVLYLSFAPVEESPETYTRFQVNSVTANGVACGISAYATPGDVTAFCQTLAKTEGIRLELPGAFALVRLAYDEEVVKAAATETVTVGGYQYPVISFKFNCTGFLADEFRDETEANQIIRFKKLKELRQGIVLFRTDVRAKAHSALVHTVRDNLIESFESAIANKQNIASINLY